MNGMSLLNCTTILVVLVVVVSPIQRIASQPVDGRDVSGGIGCRDHVGSYCPLTATCCWGYADEYRNTTNEMVVIPEPSASRRDRDRRIMHCCNATHPTCCGSLFCCLPSEKCGVRPNCDNGTYQCMNRSEAKRYPLLEECLHPVTRYRGPRSPSVIRPASLSTARVFSTYATYVLEEGLYVLLLGFSALALVVVGVFLYARYAERSGQRGVCSGCGHPQHHSDVRCNERVDSVVMSVCAACRHPPHCTTRRTSGWCNVDVTNTTQSVQRRKGPRDVNESPTSNDDEDAEVTILVHGSVRHCTCRYCRCSQCEPCHSCACVECTCWRCWVSSATLPHCPILNFFVLLLYLWGLHMNHAVKTLNNEEGAGFLNASALWWMPVMLTSLWLVLPLL